MLEKRTGMKFHIDTEGEVTFDDSGVTDPLLPLKVLDLIKAIGRGFSPERAMRLLNDDEYFEVIDIDAYVSKRPEQLARARARVIGSGGKTRRIIEDLTGASISIFGDTVCIIGNSVQLPIARQAVDMLLSGSEHSTVYRFLERSRGTLRIAEMGFDP
jgi:ribosomal RNA assembly protein